MKRMIAWDKIVTCMRTTKHPMILCSITLYLVALSKLRLLSSVFLEKIARIGYHRVTRSWKLLCLPWVSTNYRLIHDIYIYCILSGQLTLLLLTLRLFETKLPACNTAPSSVRFDVAWSLVPRLLGETERESNPVKAITRVEHSPNRLQIEGPKRTRRTLDALRVSTFPA